MRAKIINENYLQKKVSWGQDDIKLGDYVSIRKSPYKGRVYKKHLYFADTGESNAWFEKQEPGYDPVVKNYPWVSVLVKNGGAIVVPISAVDEIVEPFDLSNPWESFYF